MIDAGLMLEYADGNPQAFRRLAPDLEPRIRRFVRRRVRDPNLVDDLVQQTFVRIHASRARYDGRPPEAWCLTIARCVVLDHLRSEHRRSGRLTTLTLRHDTAGFGGPPPPPSPEQRVAEAERTAEVVRRVDAALASLSPDAREVVRRHKLQGQSMQRIADDLGVAAGTLRVRAHRAYRRLARLLAALPATEAEPTEVLCR